MQHHPDDAHPLARRRRFLLRLAGAASLPVMLPACGRRQQSKHPVNLTPDPVGEAKALLERYAGGEPLGSEREIFEDLVTRVAAADADKAAKLKAFLDEAVASGKVDAAKAKSLAGSF